jgi:hypothetical protein
VRQWVTDDDGRRVALANGGYFEKALYRDTWFFGAAPPELRRGRRPFAIPRFPRTISGWLNAVVASGLVIEAAAEPFADERTAAEHPEVADTQIAPYSFLLRHASNVIEIVAEHLRTSSQSNVKRGWLLCQDLPSHRPCVLGDKGEESSRRLGCPSSPPWPGPA